MTQIVEGLDEQATCYIIDHLRDVDRQEIFATHHDTDPRTLLAETLICEQFKGQRYTLLTDKREPVSVMGWHEMWPGVASVWAFGTDKWPSVVRTMTKLGKRVILPTLIAEGIHRAECKALAHRADTAKWLPTLGLKQEAVLVGFGSRREDFILYAWTRTDVQSL